MVFQECLGPEEARWDERASNATDHNEEATVDGTERQRKKYIKKHRHNKCLFSRVEKVKEDFLGCQAQL